MGRIGAPFGVRGWVKVHAFTARADSLLDFPEWWLGRGGDWRQVRLEGGEVHAKGLAAKLAGCEDRDQAAGLAGFEVAVPRVLLPDPAADEYYWADLIGCEVVNLQGHRFGRVARVLATGANDVLVVEADEQADEGRRETLIPFIADVIREVKPASREIRVDWGEDW